VINVRVKKDYTNQRFGRLIALRFDRMDKHGRANWLFKCDCGREVIVRLDSVLGGATRSCRCLQKEVARNNALGRVVPLPHIIKHGDAINGLKTKLYGIFTSMHQRCNNTNDEVYRRYGGRGIRVCEEWNDYLTFKAWSLTNGYKEGLTIDRKNNDGNYCPENCQWLTRSENSKKGNRRAA
jgi:hypothetical protein